MNIMMVGKMWSKVEKIDCGACEPVKTTSQLGPQPSNWVYGEKVGGIC